MKPTNDDINKAAQALGRLGKGVPKTITLAERKRRAERLAAVRVKRWPVKNPRTKRA